MQKNKKSAGFDCTKNEMVKFGLPLMKLSLNFSILCLLLLIFLQYRTPAELHRCLINDTQNHLEIIVIFPFLVV